MCDEIKDLKQNETKLVEKIEKIKENHLHEDNCKCEEIENLKRYEKTLSQMK